MGQSPATGAHRVGHGLAPAGPGDDPSGQADSALTGFPGAAVIAGAKGAVLDANSAGEPIAGLLRSGGGEDLRRAIAGAQQGRPGQINPLILEPGAGGGASGLAFDVAVLPWDEGATVLILARDITLERSLRAALIESRQRYKDLVEAASDFAWETDSRGRFTFVTSGGALGYGAAELIGALAQDFEDTGMHGGQSPFTTRAGVREAELWLRRHDGEPACLLATALPLFNSDGEWRGARGLCRDITAERRHEARLAVDRHRERLLSYILGILRDEMDPARILSAACGAMVPALPATGAAIYRRDRGGEVVCAAQAGELPEDADMRGLVERAARGESELEIARGDGLLFARATYFEESWNGFLCLWRAGSAESWRREDRILLAEVAGQIGLTNRQLARQEELEELSSTDPLTGLHNRRSFLGELERRCSRRAAWRGGAALFFIDLDNFKAVNDRHGHQRGDLALVAVARILRDHTRSRDLVARLGGDEFAVFVEDIARIATGHKGREICAASHELRSLSGGAEHPLGFSVGAAYCRADSDEAAAGMVERADKAMYEVKRRGKGGVEVSALPTREGGE